MNTQNNWNASLKKIVQSIVPDLKIYHKIIPFRIFDRLNDIIKIPSVTESIRSGIPLLSKPHKPLEKFFENAKELEKHLKKHDAFLIPFFSDLSNVSILLKEIKYKKKSILQFYDDFFQKKENIDELLESWVLNDFFSERSDIFKECLYAHAEGKHALSVPVFCIQIEACCRRLSEMSKQGKNKNWKKNVNEVYKNKKNNNRRFKHISSDFDFEPILKQIFEQTKKYKILATPDYPNRHAVLHGEDIKYHKMKFASLKCLLILDILSDKKQLDDDEE